MTFFDHDSSLLMINHQGPLDPILFFEFLSSLVVTICKYCYILTFILSKRFTLKNIENSWVWWCKPIIPDT